MLLNTWILQANPHRFRLRAALRELDGDFWPINRYIHCIARGDRILFWESGPEGGIVGIGTAQDAPYIRPGDGRTDPYFFERPADPDAPTMRLHVSYDRAYAFPLPRRVMKEDPVLCRMAIIRRPNATVFPVEPEEWEYLERLLDEHVQQGGG